MPHRSARVVALARLLKTLGHARRPGGRLPRQQQPDLIRVEYARALRREVVEPMVAAYALVKAEVLRLLERERLESGAARADAERPGDRAIKYVGEVARRLSERLEPRELENLAIRFGRRTEAFQKEQLDQQVRSALGVPLAAVERPVRDLVPTFAKANAELVQSLADRYHDRLAKDVQEAFASGMHPSTLAERFVEVDGMAERDAIRIARDQIGKLNAQVNQERQESLGVTGYIWRGAMDNRERDEHREREGQHFEWEDPPEDGHPGEPVCCRCFAEPDMTDITERVEED